MKQVVHISAECFPLAKVGGLADVVGALPKYQRAAGWEASVVMPYYHLPKMLEYSWQRIASGEFNLGQYVLQYGVYMLDAEVLGFTVYALDIPGKFDRPGVYADPQGNFYGDGPDRYLSFQHTVLKWLDGWEKLPDVIHCHDHHSGIIPFFMKFGMGFDRFREVPSVFTIHNGRYHGSFGWNMLYAFPFFDWQMRSLLEWDGVVNPLAAGIKCAWKVTTVSPSYLNELKSDSQGLEWLFESESAKSSGILNGIDSEVWNPATDPMIEVPLKKSVRKFKSSNRAALIKEFGLQKSAPVISFIGRFADEKGADLLPEVIHQTLSLGMHVNFIVLGSGNPWLHHALNSQQQHYPNQLGIFIGYNEALAHKIYAGSDFLLMPSRVEPCGLNQMYALRYGTIPVVRRIGGLNDSVTDLGDAEGSGFMFSHASVGDILHAISRAVDFYADAEEVLAVQERIMQIDFSWSRSAQDYISLYENMT
ncbi:MAG: glycogen synthase [Saprospiraceae bacterium]|nr:glycogen synthase [Saprospiraceae bacterium]